MRDADKQKSRPAAAAYCTTRPATRMRWWIAVLCLAQSALSFAAPPPILAGERVTEVLDRLRTQGLTFIYSTDVVPPRLLVQEQPNARNGIELAREVLRPYRLTVTEVVP